MKIHEQDRADKIVAANTTPRMLRLGLLRRYVTGEQYDGRPKWTNKTVPVWDREPAVIWMAPEGAITSNEDLLLADGRYPTVTTRPEEDESEDEDEALDEKASDAIDGLLRNIEREAKLRSHNRAAYCDAQSVGTCVGLFGVKNGRLFAETTNAENATAEFDINGNVTKLTIQYPYINVQRDNHGQWFAKPFLFKRVIDAFLDVTFLPGEANEDGIEPNWSPDPKKTFAHGLGFCPVLWHRFRTPTTTVANEDGRAIHARSTDELDAFNIEASIRHDGAIHSLPQKYEVGVKPGYSPTESAQTSLIIHASKSASTFNPAKPPSEFFTPSGIQQPGSRKAGPGHVWQYADPAVKVGQLELNAGALEALATTMADLRARICEQLAWVPLNPEEVKFAAALSGKALERIMARQINRVAKDRDGFGDEYLKASYCMLLRIAAKLGPGACKTRGLAKAAPYLKTFEGMSDDWNDPPLSLKWGDWFQPTPEDETAIVNTTIAAYDGGWITRKTGLEKLRRTFRIENIKSYLESLEKEEAARKQKADEEQAAEVENAIKIAHGKLNGAGAKPTGGGIEKTNPQRGSGGASITAGASKKDD